MHSHVHTAVTAFLVKQLNKQGKPAELAMDAPVFESGLLDSLGLVDLIAAVEKAMGREADMLMFDPTLVHTVQDLVDQMEASFPA